MITGSGAYNADVRAEYDVLLADLVGACRDHYGARLVALAVYGSVGRGTPRFDSDIDLLIVADGLPDGRFPRVDDFSAVETALSARLKFARDAGLRPDLSPIFKTRAELLRGTPLLLDMTEDAKILFDPECCLAETLERLRRRLRELGAKRIWRGNAWYWDLKPDYKWGDTIELF